MGIFTLDKTAPEVNDALNKVDILEQDIESLQHETYELGEQLSTKAPISDVNDLNQMVDIMNNNMDKLTDTVNANTETIDLFTNTDFSILEEEDLADDGTKIYALLRSVGQRENVYPSTHVDAIMSRYNDEAIPLKEHLDHKTDKIPGKGLSSNDYTNNDKEIVNSTTLDFPILTIDSPSVINFYNDTPEKKIRFTTKILNNWTLAIDDFRYYLEINGESIENAFIFNSAELTGAAEDSYETINLMPYFNNISDDTIYVTIKVNRGNNSTDNFDKRHILDSKTIIFRRLPLTLQPTSYIIDQRGIISDPDDMVSECFYEISYKDTSGNTITSRINCGSGYNGDPTINTITWLKKHSHAYVGTIEDGIMNLKQLDDTTRLKYADGSDSSSDIQDPTKDVWMKFPCDIYYKSEASIDFDNVESGDTPEPDKDYIKITISINPPEEGDDSWIKWDKNTLIGVYKASLSSDNKLHSLSGKIPYNNIKNKNLSKQLVDRGFYISNIEYETHTLLGVLGMGYYSTTDISNYCGKGSTTVFQGGSANYPAYPRITGLTDELASIDTTNETGNPSEDTTEEELMDEDYSKVTSINFWNLENIYGDIQEWVENVRVISPGSTNPSDENALLYYFNKYGPLTVCKLDNSIEQITDDNISSYTSLSGYSFITIFNRTDEPIRFIITKNRYGGNPTKYIYGKYCDFISRDVINTYDTFYSAIILNYTDYNKCTRGGISSNSDTSLLSLDLHDNLSYLVVGARIQFNGTDSTVNIIN